MGPNRFEICIRHYDRYQRSRAQDEASWFLNQPTLHDAISWAARARWKNGKKFDHQWRLKNSDLCRAEEALLKVERRIARSVTFDELFEVVMGAVCQIWKNPELYCYDTALRIGAKLDLKPDKVYLHRGTRIGARKLGLNTRGATLDPSALPDGLRGIEPSEIEDILCIYKDKWVRPRARVI
jgi:hypothetical protein